MGRHQLPLGDQAHDRARADLIGILGPLADELTDQATRKVLRATGWDADLAACALTIFPRPGWVASIAGPLPHPPVLAVEDE